MTLINTDGMSLIGPGSEWFWTAVSGVVLAVTLIAIYRQLRLQANQAAINASGITIDRSDFGWLAAKLGEMAREVGYTEEVDEAYLRSSLPYRLARTQDLIRVEQSLRTVTIASADAPTPAAAAAVVAAPD